LPHSGRNIICLLMEWALKHNSNVPNIISLSSSTPYADEIIGKKGSGSVHQLFIDSTESLRLRLRDKCYNYSIFIEFGIAMKMVRLIKMCLNETCSNVHVESRLSEHILFVVV
jgi:hypothetical protein